MKNISLVTIGIPFYNADFFFDTAIRSVLKQTYTNWKLILVDDGSTDNSLTIAKKYESLDFRISVFSDGLNRNLAYRLNQISILADTKYLARMDADDIMHPERIQKQVEILEKHPNIDVLGTNAYVIDDENKITGVRRNIENKIEKTSSFIHPSIMGKTSWFRENKYDEKMLRSQDAELWYRTKEKSVFYTTREPLLFYREYGGKYYIKYMKSIPSYFNLANRYFRTSEYKKSVDWFISGLKKTGKFLIYGIFALFNKESFLIKKRSLNIPTKEIEDVKEVLMQIIKH